MRIVCLLLDLLLLAAISAVPAVASSEGDDATQNRGQVQNTTASDVADHSTPSSSASIIDSVLFFDDFSAGIGNWTMTTYQGTSCPWRASDTTGRYLMPATSSSPVLATDQQLCGMVSTSATLTSSINCTSAFNVWLEWDNDWRPSDFTWNADNATVYYSTDDGVTWSTVDSFPHWYPLRGAHMFYSMPAAAGTPALKLQFRSYLLPWGMTIPSWWAIDNVKIRGDVVTGVDQISTPMPIEFALSQNYPNPFNPSTTIRYSLPEQSNVTLKVFNILGQEVTTLVNDVQTAGHNAVVWNGRNAAGSVVCTGTYFYQLTAMPTKGKTTFREVKKMLFIE